KFVYSASHDLRSPLASLKGLIFLAKEERDIDELKYYLELMLESIEKQDKFILDIIDFSRNKKTPKKIEAVNIEALIDESVNQHIYYYKDTAVEIKKDIKTREIFTDPVRLKIILNNLISNAIKYRDPKKPVTLIKILTYEMENEYCLDVVDNGIGIEHDELPKVFDMFFVSANNHIGTGLGLYIAKESINKLGGRITVNSHRGMGTKFSICLPNKIMDVEISESLKSRALS
ncbi:MAG: HAMP domain-containing sensor histidine kinase, partial [Daejeonella sp.]